MVEWIFFDVGSTLVDETRPYHDFINDCVMKLKSESIDVSYETFECAMIHASKQGLPPIRTVWGHYSQSERPVWNYEGERLVDGAIEVLDFLSHRYQLGIIANQKEGLENRLESFGILKYFRCIVGSGDVGVKKPNPEIFQLALSQCKCEAREALYVGDRYDNDILPAKRLGFTTVHVLYGLGRYQPIHDIESDYTITELASLLDICFE